MVKGHLKDNLAVIIETGKHTLISDVSEQAGGNAEGATPHQLLEAALAACTITTLQMYANRKGWSLKSTDATVHVESEGENSEIRRELSFFGELSPEQRQRLLEIANKCPIHRLLESHIQVKTNLI